MQTWIAFRRERCVARRAEPAEIRHRNDSDGAKEVGKPPCIHTGGVLRRPRGALPMGLGGARSPPISKVVIRGLDQCVRAQSRLQPPLAIFSTGVLAGHTRGARADSQQDRDASHTMELNDEHGTRRRNATGRDSGTPPPPLPPHPRGLSAARRRHPPRIEFPVSEPRTRANVETKVPIRSHHQ